MIVAELKLSCVLVIGEKQSLSLEQGFSNVSDDQKIIRTPADLDRTESWVAPPEFLIRQV